MHGLRFETRAPDACFFLSNFFTEATQRRIGLWCKISGKAKMGNVPIRAGRRVVCRSPFRCGDCSVVCSVVLEFQAELPRLVSHIGSLTAAVGSTLRDDRRGPVFLAVEVPDGVVTPEVRVTRALDRKRWGHSTRSHFTFPPHRSGNVCGEVLVDPMWPPVCTCPGRSGAISQTPHPNAGSGPVNHRTQQHRGRRPPTPPCRSTICRRQRPLPLDRQPSL